MTNSVLRTDILDSNLLTEPNRITVTVKEQFNSIVESAISVDKSVTIGPAKDIIDIMDLISKAIIDYEDRTHTTQDAKVEILYNKPDKEFSLEAISIEFLNREAGMYGQGRPFENRTQNRRPILRELVEDPDNPGYKRAVLGYFFDNVLCLTCWARTNKVASQRGLWLEQLMEEYMWYFRMNGVNRILYDGWKSNQVIDIGGNRFYGRPINYFVRTEKLWNVSQKELEEIAITLSVETS